MRISKYNMKNNELKKRILKTLAKEEKAIQLLKKTLNSNFYDAVELISKRSGKIIVTGVGKSGFIGMKISATLTSLGHSSIFLHPVEAFHGDSGVVSDGDIILAISFSGNSQEVVSVAKYLKKAFSVKLVSIIGNNKSELGKISDEIIFFKIDGEGSPLGLAPMASTTASLVIGDLLASALTDPNQFEYGHFAKFHPGGSLGLILTKVEDVMICDNKIPIINELSPLEDALKEMTSKGFGVVGICSKSNKLKGIITDGDIRRYLLEFHSIRGKKTKDVMNKRPKVISQKSTLKDAISLMENFKITTLFAVNSKKQPVGIIHMHNIVEHYLI